VLSNEYKINSMRCEAPKRETEKRKMTVFRYKIVLC